MTGESGVRGVFVDADDGLAAIAERLRRAGDPPIAVNRDPAVVPEALPAVLAGAEIAIIDHTPIPTPLAAECPGLRHVVFLGTGARSYMNPEELAGLGITVHTVKGYGDTAVAECAIALMWAAARGLAPMDRAIRAGRWLGHDGIQLAGKTLGLVGFGGVAAEVARIASGCGIRVVAWNRSRRASTGVRFASLEEVLADSDVVSLHLLLTDETRGFLSRERVAMLKLGVILVNTARGALVDEEAMVEALRRRHIRHAGLDVFAVEPLPAGHILTTLDNVTLCAHSAFRTPEASDNLVGAALDHCRRIAAGRPAHRQ